MCSRYLRAVGIEQNGQTDDKHYFLTQSMSGFAEVLQILVEITCVLTLGVSLERGLMR